MHIAIVMTVKNESRLLADNVRFHADQGVETFFIFDDGGDESVGRSLGSLAPRTVVAPSATPADFDERPELGTLLASARDQYSARIGLNAVSALDQAERLGVDWLISLDADELVCVSAASAEPEQLKRFFTEVHDGIDQVRFSTFEVVPRRFRYDRVFEEETLFLRPGAKIRRQVLDPFEDTTFHVEGFLGQSLGKVAVRPRLRPVPRTTHEFVTRDGRSLGTLCKDGLLHYYCYDYADFVKKYTNIPDRPNRYIFGDPVERQKRLWRDLVNSSGPEREKLAAYYERWIMFEEAAVRHLRKKRTLSWSTPPITEIHTPRLVFERLGE